MSLYNKKEWKEFRDNVIESDGYKCVSCGREKFEVTLQVHHKVYFKGKLPWEYGTENCETLCKGCHAAEHGIIQPKIGWEFIGQEDSGEFSSQCENSGCGSTIRHKYLISHPNWGFLEVGTICCDNLTDSNIASNKKEALNRYKSRKSRFVASKRWKIDLDNFIIKQALFDIKITQKPESHFELSIHKLISKIKYETLQEAKEAAFDAIESGSLLEYLDNHHIKYRKKKK
jgi:hypothetical protein